MARTQQNVYNDEHIVKWKSGIFPTIWIYFPMEIMILSFCFA